LRVSSSSDQDRPLKRVDVEWVSRKLSDMIAAMQPGDRIPKHTELMRQMQASERTILQALGRLQDEGKIVRQNGKGTFVAEQSAEGQNGSSGMSLTTADSRTIVAIAKPDHSFFDRCIQVLFRYVDAENLHLVCRLIDPKTAMQLIPPSGSGKPLGFILFRNDMAPLADQLQASGNRVVLVGSQSEDRPIDVPTIHGDHDSGGYLAVNHLIELGHRRIAYAGDAGRQQLRLRGHERAISDAKYSGVAVSSTLIDYDTQDAWKRDPMLAAAYFRQADAPTGVVVWNDHEAAALLATLTRAGIQVPKDVSLVGYDNVPESERVYPALTTIDAGIPQIVRMAAEMLTGALPPKRAQTVIVVPTLIKRDSSGPPP
jgi:GntR family transcriptional regulator of arabinose operon